MMNHGLFTEHFQELKSHAALLNDHAVLLTITGKLLTARRTFDECLKILHEAAVLHEALKSTSHAIEAEVELSEGYIPDITWNKATEISCFESPILLNSENLELSAHDEALSLISLVAMYNLMLLLRKAGNSEHAHLILKNVFGLIQEKKNVKRLDLHPSFLMSIFTHLAHLEYLCGRFDRTLQMQTYKDVVDWSNTMIAQPHLIQARFHSKLAHLLLEARLLHDGRRAYTLALEMYASLELKIAAMESHDKANGILDNISQTAPAA